MEPPTCSVDGYSHIPHDLSYISRILSLFFTYIPHPPEHFIAASHISKGSHPPTSQKDVSPPASLSYFSGSSFISFPVKGMGRDPTPMYCIQMAKPKNDQITIQGDIRLRYAAQI